MNESKSQLRWLNIHSLLVEINISISMNESKSQLGHTNPRQLNSRDKYQHINERKQITTRLVDIPASFVLR